MLSGRRICSPHFKFPHIFRACSPDLKFKVVRFKGIQFRVIIDYLRDLSVEVNLLFFVLELFTYFIGVHFIIDSMLFYGLHSIVLEHFRIQLILYFQIQFCLDKKYAMFSRQDSSLRCVLGLFSKYLQEKKEILC